MIIKIKKIEILHQTITQAIEMYCGGIKAYLFISIDETITLVADCGSYTSKFGFAGENIPRYTIRSVF